MADNKKIATPSNLPWITRFKMFTYPIIRRLCTRPDGSINRRVLSLFDVKAPAPATKLIDTTAVSTSDVPVDPSRNLWFRLFIPSPTTNTNNPEGKNLLPLIIYFHGGGFTNYGPDSKDFDNLCCHLAAKVPAVIASVNYRLAPEYRYPTQYEDAFDAIKFINAQNYSVLPAIADLKRCYLAGDSAGGNIAHHMTLRACKNPLELENVKIVGLLAIQPFFGGEERTDSELRLMHGPLLTLDRTDYFWRSFLPEDAGRNHPAAHVFGDGQATAALKNMEFPRVLVIEGGYDLLQDWQKQYVRWLENCGKEVELIQYPNAFHGFYGCPELPEFDLLSEDVAKFIQKQANL